ncbi:hypothetical protein QAD02_009162 [Eretmocerus hayati]|uniref:Uncharacterized protein n=1 Tax=Eretmocerus hayati TaxID=131215 RepID=A0ACC2N8X8_9HYME|nr:hypothetical protein QAD02_009162 [Eretmocerus hayati]
MPRKGGASGQAARLRLALRSGGRSGHIWLLGEPERPAGEEKSLVSIFHWKNTSITVELLILGTKNEVETCATQPCQDAATILRGNMNRDVQPCDDFYQFACGNYANKLSQTNDSASASSLLSDHTIIALGRLKRALKRRTANEEPKTFKKLRGFYNVCMNESSIDATSEAGLQKIMEDLGGWPILVGKSWNESNFDWIEIMLKIDSLGFAMDQFFSVAVSVDSKNNSQFILQLKGPSFGIDREYLLRTSTPNQTDRIIDAYFNYMVKVAKILNPNGTDIKEQMEGVLEFERSLANITSSERLQRDMTQTHNILSLAEMQIKYPYVEWSKFLEKLVPSTIHLSPSYKINLADRDYFEKFPNILAKTSNRTLANYALWNLVRNAVPYLSKRIRDSSKELEAEFYGTAGLTPRWIECILAMKDELPVATGALYVRRYLDKDSKQNVTDLFYRLRRAFNETLKAAEWMDNKTRVAAMEKLKHMEPLVAYPDEYLDDKILDTYHEKVKISSNSYLKSSLSLSYDQKKRSYEYLGKKVDRKDWVWYQGATTDVNAYYNFDLNLVDVKAGMLQGIIYNRELPQYMNYASTGFILGHEISHGFDDQGRTRDKDGNLRDWWDLQTRDKFLNKTKCVIDQFSNYSFKVDGESLHQNPQQAIGENIADLGGLKISYDAYKNWQREFGDEPRLPGLEMFTPEQMFWISFANSWCAKYKTTYLRDLIETETHAIVPYRINGPISNRPEFSRDFKCSDRSPMNRINKCNVW